MDERRFGIFVKLLSLLVRGSEERRRFRKVCREAFRGLSISDNVMKTTVEMAIATSRMHEKTFAEFKGCNTDKDVVVVATGPSLEHFNPIKDAVYIGVNKAYRLRDIQLDYLFAIDYSGLRGCISEMNTYRKGICRKFYGLYGEKIMIGDYTIPEAEAIEAEARRFRTNWWPPSEDGRFREHFALDLTSEMLASHRSVIFPALQFALWTNPRRIYLVGCDCSGTAHFPANGNFDTGRDFGDLVMPYIAFRAFVARYYPKTEIVSVNPVGLKGIFTDLYQDE